MKAKRYCIFAAVLGAVLCGFAAGEIEWPREQDKGLVAHPNLTLRWINEISVVIEPSDGEPNADGLLWEQLDGKVLEKLSKSGVKVKSLSSLARPQLRISVDMLRLKDSEICVFHVQTSLSRRSVLEGQSRFHIKPDVWKARAVMAAASVDEMSVKVTELVLEQVESFVTCLLMANPASIGTVDANAVGKRDSVKRTKPTAQVAWGKYPYVASKNSKVFHVAGCQWADTIKRENLIGFANRAEALRSGRRPCRRCGGQVERRGR